MILNYFISILDSMFVKFKRINNFFIQSRTKLTIDTSQNKLIYKYRIQKNFNFCIRVPIIFNGHKMKYYYFFNW